MSTETYLVDGMTCGHCVSAVQHELLQLGGVTAASVDLVANSVTVEAEKQPELAEISAAVTAAGYTLRVLA